MPNGFLLATDAILKLKPAFEDFLQFACSDLILSFFFKMYALLFQKIFYLFAYLFGHTAWHLVF